MTRRRKYYTVEIKYKNESRWITKQPSFREKSTFD